MMAVNGSSSERKEVKNFINFLELKRVECDKSVLTTEHAVLKTQRNINETQNNRMQETF